ncbi:MAG: hypothetical protein ACRD1E_01770, partial [Terriglobales bacterium]
MLGRRGMPVARRGSGTTGNMKAGKLSAGAACMPQIAPATGCIGQAGIGQRRWPQQAAKPPELTAQLSTGRSSSKVTKMIGEFRTCSLG